MTTVRWIMAATLLGAVALTSPLRAEDLSVPNLGNNSQALNPNDVRQSDTAEAAQSVSIQDQSPSRRRPLVGRLLTDVLGRPLASHQRLGGRASYLCPLRIDVCSKLGVWRS
jgi:hypothetical protein